MHLRTFLPPRFLGRTVLLLITLVGAGTYVGVPQELPPPPWPRPIPEHPDDPLPESWTIDTVPPLPSPLAQFIDAPPSSALLERVQSQPPSLFSSQWSFSGSFRNDLRHQTLVARPQVGPLDLLNFWQHWYLANLFHATRGTPDVPSEAARMWQQAISYANSCNTLVECEIGLVLLELSLNAVANALLGVERLEEDGLAGAAADFRKELSWIERSFREHTLSNLSLHKAIASEYWLTRNALEQSTCWPRDRTQTEAQAADYYVSLLQGVRPPAPKLPWLLHPCGQGVWERTHVTNLEDHVRRYQQRKGRLRTRQGELADRLQRAMQRR